ncbi:hypothetical protein SAMN04489712_10348 [Thermomonospora echinospora]|uniref:DNA-directed RNA polymerase specialized sigma subunit, sigma24 family n=1 Tax=Thermomonospora echinospora TaxID=1992 RepID=A0A1H5X2U9_9ACTN|nr:hypothetical protein [Thermomonospora echinospora]SEG05546.1 hypothetical protein SAMN04489712_10348 [Thermomonospora echinospora]
MPQKAPPGAVLERRYRDLVRLAYLVLPGNTKRIYRLALAQRIVDGEFPLIAGRAVRPSTGRYGYARMRTRVLRRAMRPSWRLRVGLGPWLRGLPVRLPDPALTMALAELDPAVRVAYVLREVERMPRYAVRDLLVELGVPDVPAVLEAAEAADGMPEACGRAADVVVDVSVRRAHERAIRRRSRLPIAVATALTIALVGTVFVLETSPSTSPAAARQARLVMLPPRDWGKTPRTLDVWPARGGLVGDRAFTGRALTAWARRAGRGDPQLLYAGRVGDTPTAMLRHGARIARYTEPRRTLEDVPATGRGPSGLLDLGGGHYLLPPWATGAQAPDGGRIAVDDGATGPLTARTPCHRGPLLWFNDRQGPVMLADLGGPAPAAVHYRSAKGTAAKAVAPGSSGRRLWDRLACARPASTRPVADAAAWEFWSGKLPDQARAARWVCTRYTYADGGTSARATLIEPGGRAHETGACDPRRPVSGLWWRSPRKHWYYVAASAPGAVPHVTGPVEVAGRSGRLLVATGPRLKRRPAGRVTLTARHADAGRADAGRAGGRPR